MQQINNGYCSCYYLTEDGRLYNADTKQYKSANKEHRFSLKREDGSCKKIALKQLYKIVYGKPFCIDNIESLKDEEWKEIENTEGVYFVSNLGRIKSYSGYEALLLKPTITPKGYYRLDIVQEGQRATKLVHRLVAAAFLLPPKSIDMQLHHKDFDKSNNAAANIEWLTIREHNKKHITRREQIKNGTIADSTKPKGYNS